MALKHKVGPAIYKIFQYLFCIFLALLSLMPFIIMVVNATRSSPQIESHAISLIPSHYIGHNYKVLTGKSFNALRGFCNSLIIASGATVCTI